MHGGGPDLPGNPDMNSINFVDVVRNGERVFLSAANALRKDGSVQGLGDAVAQTEVALDQLQTSLESVGGSLRNLTKLTTSVIDRGYRSEVYATIARRLPGVRVVSTGLVVEGLAQPELIVQIDAEAAIPTKTPRYTRPYTFESWHGQAFPWEGSMVVATDDEFFVRGQTGSGLDHSGVQAKGRSVSDAGDQVNLAMTNLATLLEEAGADPADIAKVTVYISDRAYWNTAYATIGRHLMQIRPVSIGVITTSFARPDILFEIDVTIPKKRNGEPHRRLRSVQSRDPEPATQELGCETSLAVVAGNRVVLQGQTGMGLDGIFRGAGDAVAQAEQAIANVETLLREAGVTILDIVKVVIYVTDRAFLDDVKAAVSRKLMGVVSTFSCMIAKGLERPEYLVEIEITALNARQPSLAPENGSSVK